jgi:terminase small subunit / prophage DNA-packing protein
MRMTKGGSIAKNTGKPMDDSVDAATVARWLNCSTRQLREYVERGLVVRTGPKQFDLEASVRGVVLYLRELASGHRSEGVDVVKASAELKQSQKRLVDLRYNQLRAKLISMDEVEAMWSDLILATQFLFRSIAPRFRERAPHLSPQHYEMLQELTQELLREVAIAGKAPVPQASSSDASDHVHADVADD